VCSMWRRCKDTGAHRLWLQQRRSVTSSAAAAGTSGLTAASVTVRKSPQQISQRSLQLREAAVAVTKKIDSQRALEAKTLFTKPVTFLGSFSSLTEISKVVKFEMPEV